MPERIPAIKVILLPKDTNPGGSIFGGVILSHVDLASAVEARKAGRHRYVTKAMERPMYTTFMASCFRSIRFGLTEAHGRGIALQLNSLLDAGGFKVNPDGTFVVDAAKVKAGVEALTRRIMLGGNAWATRIGSFSIPGCVPLPVALQSFEVE